MKKLRFLVSLTTNDNDYQIEQAQSAEEAARKFGVELQVIYAENDTITHSTQLLKAIQAEQSHRPYAIIFEPVGGTALPQVARAAASAGIGWAVLNRDANYVSELRKSSSAPVFVVTSDRKSTRLNSCHVETSYAVFCLKKKSNSTCFMP